MNTDRLLDNMIQDKHLFIRNSESAEYLEPIEKSVAKLYSYCLESLPSVFNQQKQINLFMPKALQSTDEPLQQIDLIHKILIHFFEQSQNKKESTDCSECKNYEQNLQKLENDIRQHIRLEHQLKLYQQNLEEKIEQMKKQNEERLQTLSQLKSQIHKYKSQFSKLEPETDRPVLERNKSEYQFNKIDRTSSMRKSLKKFYHEGKQNLAIKNRSMSKNGSRKSVEKRAQKDKLKNTIVRPIKHNPLSEKVMNKNKEEKKKAIQAKFVL